MKKIINCPYCGKIHSIKLDSDLNNLYVLPGTKQRSKLLWSSFGDKKKILVSEVTCPYCNRVFTVVSLKKEVASVCTIKRPPIMRLLFANILFSIMGRKVKVFPLYWILFGVMIMEYSRARLMLSFLSAALLIASICLFHAIKAFQTFDFFGTLPLNLSEVYLRKNAPVLNCLFIKGTFKNMASVELFSVGFGLFKFLQSNTHTLFYLIYFILLSLFFMYLFVMPVIMVVNIYILIEIFSYKIVFDKWSKFNELGQVILGVLSPSLVMSIGFALFVFMTENKALEAITFGLVLILSTGITGINLLWAHHRNIKHAKLREIEKLQRILQEEYKTLISGQLKYTRFSEIQTAIEAVQGIEEWPRSFKYLITAMVTVGTMVLSALISHFLR